MSDQKEIIIVCECGRHHSSHNRSNGHYSSNSNYNRNAVQRRSDQQAEKKAAAVGGALVGAGLVFLLAAFLSD